MKLIHGPTVSTVTKVGEFACQTCSAKYELVFADLICDPVVPTNLGAKWYWKCQSCGEKNSYSDPEIEKKLEILKKISTQSNLNRRNCDYD
mgnify:CR=1 FL=1